MFSLRQLAAGGALLAAAVFGPVTAHAAGTVILEGSDAIGFHCPLGNGAACTYEQQVWSAIGGASPLPIAVIGNNISGTATPGGTHTVDNFATLAAAGSLSQYVALYFLATDGCCTENDASISAPGAATAVAAYLAAGGTVMIENYVGGSAWDFAVGAGGTGNSHVAGVGGGLASDLSCDDGETVTPAGTTNGFTQPTPMGCWTHQAYDSSFFGPLGFSKCYFAAPTDIGQPAADCSLLANGNTVTGGGNGGAVPEPASLAIFGIGLVGFAFMRRGWTSFARKTDGPGLV